MSLACTSAPCCNSICTILIRLYPAAKCNGVDRLPSLAWQLTLSGDNRASKRSSAPDRAASSNSSLRYSPVNTGRVLSSARSNGIFCSEFLMFGLAPCCNRATQLNIKLILITTFFCWSKNNLFQGQCGIHKWNLRSCNSLTNAHIDFSLASCLMQWRIVPIVGRIWTSTGFQ